MQTQRLGTSDLVTTRLAYGNMRSVGTWNPADITPQRRAAGIAAHIAAYEAGYTLFDTADIYCAGGCETNLGETLKEVSGMRERIVITTKCGIRFENNPPGTPHRFDFSKEHILWSCEQSLKRLGIETIDLYHLHRPDLLMNPPEIAEAFDQLHRAGKVRYFGVSNFSHTFVSALQSGLKMPLIVNQVEIHLSRLDCFYDGTLDQCIERKITPLAWSPLGGGFLGDGGKLDEKHPKYSQRKALITLLDETAARYNISRSVLALAWLLKHPSGIIPIIGSANPANIKAAAQADGVRLSREDWYRLLVAARGEKLP
ncbi:MAG TPA: aldo/keto reductase [Tepidisphaeraceae bacterium]|jgi:predicted oxidoreductase